MNRLYKKDDIVRYNGDIIVTQDGFMWESLYYDLDINTDYKILDIWYRRDGIYYYSIKNNKDINVWFPESVFYQTRNIMSKKYGLK